VSFILLSFVRVPKETLEEFMDDEEDQVTSAPPTARDETLIDLEPELDNPQANVGPRSNTIPDSPLVDV
jgi:hypothetical protein